jgi:transposase InsO family protein
MARDGVGVGPEFAGLVARVHAGEVVNVRAECARVGVSPKTLYKYVKRFEVEGVEGLFPRSRRPHRCPSQVGSVVEDAVVLIRKRLQDQGWDAGAEQIRFWVLDHGEDWPVGQPLPSRATINRILRRRGQIVATPQRRPRRVWRRFEAPYPNSMWQMDGFEHTLDGGGGQVTILQVIDDCSRLDLALRVACSENSREVWEAFLHASSRYGLPSVFLTDNGSAFSGRRRGWLSAVEENLHALGVKAITSSIGHPQTCGKNERAHSTVRQWLRKQPPATTPEQLQQQLDHYQHHYNHHRRKTHLNAMTPAQRYELGPYDGPHHTIEMPPLPVLISTAHVATNGTIHRGAYTLGVGRKHAGQTLTVITQHHHITLFHHNQYIAEYTLTPGHRYTPKTQ